MMRVQTYRIIAHLPNGVWTAPTCARCDGCLSEYEILLGHCPVCHLVFCAVDMWNHGCAMSHILAAVEESRARRRMEIALSSILSMGRRWTVAAQRRLLASDGA